MSNQRKYFVVKNDYHLGKMFGSAATHKTYLNMPYIKWNRFWICIKKINNWILFRAFFVIKIN